MRADEYPTTKIIVLGVFTILLGLVSIALGIASATPTPSGNYPFGPIGYGIWGGVIYVISGIIGIITGAKASNSWILNHLVFSIFACLVALTQFSIAIAAAYLDYTVMQIRQLRATGDPEDKRYADDLGTYLAYFFPMVYQLSQPGNRLVNMVYAGAVAVDSLLASFGIIMALIAMSAFATGCRFICCRKFLDEEEEPKYSSRI